MRLRKYMFSAGLLIGTAMMLSGCAAVGAIPVLRDLILEELRLFHLKVRRIILPVERNGDQLCRRKIRIDTYHRAVKTEGVFLKIQHAAVRDQVQIFHLTEIFVIDVHFLESVVRKDEKLLVGK